MHRWILFMLLMVSAVPSAVMAESASDLPSEVVIDGIPFVLIPEGNFTFTAHTGAARSTLKPGQQYYRDVSIWLDSFYIGKWEARAVTLARYLNEAASQAVRDDYQRGWDRPASAKAPVAEGCSLKLSQETLFEVNGDPYWPATDLSWELAHQLATWLGFRLPTEAEWQKAARGSDPQIWPWGNTFPDDTYANFGMGRHCHPEPVNQYPRGASPYGALQMAGNVSEYVVDWYNEHNDSQLTDGTRNPVPPATATPLPFEEPQRISKGGDWGGGPTFLAIGFRNYRQPDLPQNRAGVRFALDAQKVIELIAAGKASVSGRIEHYVEK
ncbi:SUMF1/EgtB/PvdO family nonheme iron enzyme [Motiliproteus sp. SC1-56]|uniref:formylglycine-generating enzyme family protein n=1 Tax=Motiliproteus sp. SC1-56 TaxID=2799565 RepID=UPI001A8E70B3|nr:SUMF1/EgtB/PvdO family nonheme iron enzyme [Motiliproteus sp. SC1-56]